MNSQNSGSDTASYAQASSQDFSGLVNDMVIDLFELGPTASQFQFRALTLHNWMQAVYRAFNCEMPLASNETALLAIREATFAKRKPAQAASADAAEQASGQPSDISNYDFSAQERAAGMTPTSVTFNDVLILAYTPEHVQESQHTDVFECTVDPGQKESDADGMPFQCEGHLYSTLPSVHQGYTIGKGKDFTHIVALQIYSSAPGIILMARDATAKRYKRHGSHAIFAKIQSALLPASDKTAVKDGKNSWQFCKEETNTTFHIHWSKVVSTSVKNWSTGCTAIHEDQEGTRYKDVFLKRVKSAPNSAHVPYLVVSSQYVKLYDDLYFEFERHTQEMSIDKLAKMVIKKDALRPHPDPKKAGLYLPSFVSSAFADAVHKLATELSEAADAAEVSESLRVFLSKNGVPKNKQKPALLLELSKNLVAGLDNCCFRLNPILFPPICSP